MANETEMVNALNTPDEVTVTITYKRGWWRRYREVIPLDAKWMGHQTSSVSSASDRGRFEKITDAAKKIADEAQGINRALSGIESILTPPPPPAPVRLPKRKAAAKP